MSATVWCQLANGKEHTELHSTEKSAVDALNRTLDLHRGQGRNVSEQKSQYVVTDPSGNVVAKYELRSQ
jgi:hypothetical protein